MLQSQAEKQSAKRTFENKLNVELKFIVTVQVSVLAPKTRQQTLVRMKLSLGVRGQGICR